MFFVCISVFEFFLHFISSFHLKFIHKSRKFLIFVSHIFLGRIKVSIFVCCCVTLIFFFLQAARSSHHIQHENLTRSEQRKSSFTVTVVVARKQEQNHKIRSHVDEVRAFHLNFLSHESSFTIFLFCTVVNIFR